MSEIESTMAAAFIKAQKEMGAALKTSVNPHLKSKYADLASVWNACFEALNNNGFFISQPFARATQPGHVAVQTRLVHVSGGELSSVCELPLAQNTPQGFGSGATYARRYGLAALAGVITEDDDGHAATNALSKAATIASLKSTMKAAKALISPEPGMLTWPTEYEGKHIENLTAAQLQWSIKAATKQANEQGGDMWAKRLLEFTDEYARREAEAVKPK